MFLATVVHGSRICLCSAPGSTARPNKFIHPTPHPPGRTTKNKVSQTSAKGDTRTTYSPSRSIVSLYLGQPTVFAIELCISPKGQLYRPMHIIHIRRRPRHDPLVRQRLVHIKPLPQLHRLAEIRIHIMVPRRRSAHAPRVQGRQARPVRFPLMRPELIIVPLVRAPVGGHVAHEAHGRVGVVFQPLLDVVVGPTPVATLFRTARVVTFVGPQAVEGELVSGAEVWMPLEGEDDDPEGRQAAGVGTRGLLGAGEDIEGAGVSGEVGKTCRR